MPRGPKPKPAGAALNTQRVHEWVPAPGKGWQHGETIPTPPDDLHPDSLRAWAAWFGAWYASYWSPEDLPLIELTATLHSKLLRGQIGPEKLTPYLDRIGVTRKGQQDNRWSEAVEEVPVPSNPETTAEADQLAAKRQERRSKLA